MSIRTSRSTVTFMADFSLRNVAGTLPAGIYEVETDEEIIEGNDRTVYRRVATLLHIRSAGMTRTCTIDPKDLAAAVRIVAEMQQVKTIALSSLLFDPSSATLMVAVRLALVHPDIKGSIHVA